MSIMIDNKYRNRNKSKTISIPEHTPTLQPLIWISDSKVDKCHKCDISFSFINRRHHCRLCGRIFCGYCCNQFSEIPELLHRISDQNWWSFQNTTHRLCKSCYSDVKIIHDFPAEFYMFLEIPLTIKEIFQLRCISKKWRNIINLLILKYKRIQYLLPCQKISRMEETFLRNHRFEYLNHPELMYKLISRTHFNFHLRYISKLPKQQMYGCREVLCNRNCLHQTKIEHILEWLHFQDRSSDIFQLILKNIDNINTYDFLNIFPLLLHFGNKFPELYTLISTKCLLHKKLMYSLYFHFKCWIRVIDDMVYKAEVMTEFDHFVDLMPKKDTREIETTCEFIRKLETIQTVEHILEINKWLKNNNVFIPWDCTLKCLSILQESFEIIHSKTRPIKIGILVRTKYSQEMVINVILKQEDVQKDYLSIIISRWINKICRKHVDIKTYHILPVHSTFGIIEMVDNVVSLYDISNKYQTNLYKYITERNPEKSINVIRTHFIRSCVGSCISSYLLGLGDRHLENILLTSDGKIFHIDFDYLLGEDPKHVSVEMMITEDMLDMIGGRNSTHFKTFQRECEQAYVKLRQRNNLWYFLFMYLHKRYPEKYSETEIQSYLIDKLVPGESNINANTEIIKIIRNSSDLYFPKYFTNFTHDISRKIEKIGKYLDLRGYFNN
jgi:hypothetical protein